MKGYLMTVYAMILAVISMVLDVTLFWKEVTPAMQISITPMDIVNLALLCRSFYHGGAPNLLGLDCVMPWR
jgi:hypothetical protein